MTKQGVGGISCLSYAALCVLHDDESGPLSRPMMHDDERKANYEPFALMLVQCQVDKVDQTAPGGRCGLQEMPSTRHASLACYGNPEFHQPMNLAGIDKHQTPGHW